MRLDSIGTAFAPSDLALSNTVAYVTSPSGALETCAVGNPTNLSAIGSHNTSDNLAGVAARGNLAYVIDFNADELKVFRQITVGTADELTAPAGLGLFPNPARQRVRVVLPTTATAAELTIHDATGRVYPIRGAGHSSGQPRLRRLSAGVYSVRCGVVLGRLMVVE